MKSAPAANPINMRTTERSCSVSSRNRMTETPIMRTPAVTAKMVITTHKWYCRSNWATSPLPESSIFRILGGIADVMIYPSSELMLMKDTIN